MSREVISNEKYPLKAHNCKLNFRTSPSKLYSIEQIADNSSTCGQNSGSRVRLGSSRTGRHQVSHCEHSRTPVPSISSPGLRDSRLTRQIQSVTALKEVLELAGSSLEKVVKFNIYLKDMNDMLPMNDVIVSVSVDSPVRRFFNRILAQSTPAMSGHSWLTFAVVAGRTQTRPNLYPGWKATRRRAVYNRDRGDCSGIDSEGDGECTVKTRHSAQILYAFHLSCILSRSIVVFVRSFYWTTSWTCQGRTELSDIKRESDKTTESMRGHSSLLESITSR